MYPIFAKLTSDSSFMEQINYMLVCFTLVCLVLAVMWACTSFIGIFFKKSDAKKAANTPAPLSVAPAPAAAANSSAENAKIAAVISAAVFAVMKGTPHRIVSIKPAEIDFKWAQSGRNAIFASKGLKK